MLQIWFKCVIVLDSSALLCFTEHLVYWYPVSQSRFADLAGFLWKLVFRTSSYNGSGQDFCTCSMCRTVTAWLVLKVLPSKSFSLAQCSCYSHHSDTPGNNKIIVVQWPWAVIAVQLQAMNSINQDSSSQVACVKGVIKSSSENI